MAGLEILLSLVITLFYVTLPVSVIASRLWAIDCGSQSFYTDNNSIVWSPDYGYVQTGVNQIVQTAISSDVLKTLRSFPNGKKNCYSFSIDNTSRVLIRSIFYYGNYDNKSLPPTFDLQFNGNYWATVKTSMDQIIQHEAIFVATGDVINVCVAKSNDNHVPFMSALELNLLAWDMYSIFDSNYALFLINRVAFGATEVVRHSTDPYDRIWDTSKPKNGLSGSSLAPSIKNTGSPEKPPAEILQTAITTENTSSHLFLPTNLPNTDVSVSINMYFSEITPLESKQKRVVQIFVNDLPIGEPIVPPFGGVVSRWITNITANADTVFELRAVEPSTLPPLINAMEVFVQSSTPFNTGTSKEDINGLSQLKEQFEKLKEWSGDPCLPPSYNWEWITCSSDTIPRVTALKLNGYGLEGIVPDFSSMEALETIDLHNNSLVGLIPGFLGSFPNLKELNLADNRFSGSILCSLVNKKNLNLVVSGNKKLFTDPSCQPRTTTESSTSTEDGRKLPIILGISVSIFVIFIILAVVFLAMHRKRRRIAMNACGPGPGPDSRKSNTSGWDPHPVQAFAGQCTVDEGIKDGGKNRIGFGLASLLDQEARAEREQRNSNLLFSPI